MAKTHEKPNTEFISKLRERDSNHEFSLTITFFGLAELDGERERESER